MPQWINLISPALLDRTDYKSPFNRRGNLRKEFNLLNKVVIVIDLLLVKSVLDKSLFNHFKLFHTVEKPVDWSGRREDSCGFSGTGETPQAKLRRLTARPTESEAPGTEINSLKQAEKMYRGFIIQKGFSAFRQVVFRYSTKNIFAFKR
ncbi:hypothetical protein [Peribacillus kribbensis]|uniref:hypothetical protein n=1 Tax=Peribacillus kribbensis TaxID=356658 RepID=UPI00047BA275|nr:hypothetical protein [Peribacillus kribbensis]